MKKIISLVILVLFSVASYGQVQWANKVLNVSSEKQVLFDNHQYKGKQVLGEPNVLPAINSSACAWSPSKTNSPEEAIKVGFKTPMNIKQVLIAQSNNAGAVFKVYLFDTGGKSHLIYRKSNIVAMGGGILSLKVPRTNYKVAAVRVHLAPFKVSGYNEIDAIGISQTEAKYVPKINLAKELGAKSKSEKLGPNVNTSSAEIVPVISADGKTLFFTRDGHPGNIKDTDGSHKQDVWTAKINDDGSISKAFNIGAPINTKGYNAAFSVSADGNTLLLLNKYTPTQMVKGYSISKKVADKWTKPTSINVSQLINLSEQTAVYLSQDKKVLLLSIKDEDSHGGNDLYVSFHQGGNNWSKPKNLGPTVNTAEEEKAPFLSADGTTLYFASKGYSGYGNTDIYISRRLDDTWTNWSIPKNLGKEVNSQNWESYFSIEASGVYAYYTRDADIHRIKLQDENRPKAVALLKGVVSDVKIKKPLSANINISKIPSNTNVASDKSDPNTGAYKNILKLGGKYQVTAELKGYFPQTVEIDISDKKNYLEIVQNFELSPLIKGVSVRLDHIYFNRAKAKLLPESFPELDKVYQMMVDNPTVSIKLEGHTEIYGNRKSLTVLSENRVASVKRYLVGKGIGEKRIKYKGFGPSKPLSKKDTEEARKLNRRVEVKIL